MKRLTLALAALAVAIGGVLLWRELRSAPSTPTPAASTSSAGGPASSSMASRRGVVRPPKRMIQRREPAALPSDEVPAPATDSAPASPTAKLPGPRVDLRPRARGVPGLDDGAGDRLVLAPAPPTAYADELAEARAAVRRGEIATASAVARKIAAAEPDNAGARRLAASTACQLGDRAYIDEVWPHLSTPERQSLLQRCRAAGIEVDLGAPMVGPKAPLDGPKATADGQ